MKPTPRPWHTGRHPNHDCSVRYVLALNGYEVCSTFNDLEENVANVDLIARACNAHEDLLKALKEIASFKGKTLISTTGESYEEGANEAFDQLADIAATVLAQAEGES